MSHEISPDNHYVEGESVTWEYTIEEDGSAKDLSGASLSYYLLNNRGDANSDAVKDDGDSGVSVAFTSDGSDGRVDVTIDQGVTDGLNGTYWQRLEVDDTGTGLQKWSGPFPINRP